MGSQPVLQMTTLGGLVQCCHNRRVFKAMYTWMIKVKRHTTNKANDTSEPHRTSASFILLTIERFSCGFLLDEARLSGPVWLFEAYSFGTLSGSVAFKALFSPSTLAIRLSNSFRRVARNCSSPRSSRGPPCCPGCWSLNC